MSVRRTRTRRWHYAVTPAKTGREAAAKFIADLPDLVLLDLNLPDRDGWDAFDLMHQTHPLVPVIVITARSQQYQRASERGVDALMEKPLNLPLLLAAIADFLAEPELERILRVADPGFKAAYLKNSPPKHSDESSGGLTQNGLLPS